MGMTSCFCTQCHRILMTKPSNADALCDVCQMIPMEFSVEDAEIILEVLNQGIDSRLEGFKRSTFQYSPGPAGFKLYASIHPSEMTTLLRRLLEVSEVEDSDAGDDAGNLADFLTLHYLSEEDFHTEL